MKKAHGSIEPYALSNLEDYLLYARVIGCIGYRWCGCGTITLTATPGAIMSMSTTPLSTRATVSATTRHFLQLVGLFLGDDTIGNCLGELDVFRSQKTGFLQQLN